MGNVVRHTRCNPLSFVVVPLISCTVSIVQLLPLLMLLCNVYQVVIDWYELTRLTATIAQGREEVPSKCNVVNVDVDVIPILEL